VTIAQQPGYRRLVRDVGLLLIASALAMVLANLAPVVVTAMLTQDPASAAGFAGAVVLTRVPLLFMGPIQALLLPGMTAAAAAGDRARLAATLRRGLAVIAALGVVAVIGTWFLGRPVITLLFGAERDTTQSVPLVILTASAVIFMAVQLLQPALVALRRHRALVVAWIAGAVAFSAAFLVPIPSLDQGLLAQLAGPVVTLFVQLAVLAGEQPSSADAVSPDS
jgi:O-antigen/teichoic acid export membrane protein